MALLSMRDEFPSWLMFGIIGIKCVFAKMSLFAYFFKLHNEYIIYTNPELFYAL